MAHTAILRSLSHSCMCHYRVSKRSWFQKHRAFPLDRDKVAYVKITPLLEILVSIDAADGADHGPTPANPSPLNACGSRPLPHPRRTGCNLIRQLITWGEHPRPTSRPAVPPHDGSGGLVRLKRHDRQQGCLSTCIKRPPATTTIVTLSPVQPLSPCITRATPPVCLCLAWRFASPKRSDQC